MINTFITKEDYDASIHREILDALIREDDNVLDVCENQAVAEMRSFLAERYDCDAIFSQTGDSRHPLILMFAKDIAIYHVFCQHNPQKLSQMRIDRYNHAMDWLQRVADGDIAIDGAPFAEGQASKRNFAVSSNRLRVTHF